MNSIRESAGRASMCSIALVSVSARVDKRMCVDVSTHTYTHIYTSTRMYEYIYIYIYVHTRMRL